MGRDMFRLFKPDGPTEDKAAKRRGQLRRAQQTFRERKEKYTKAVESELAATRARETELAQQCDRLRVTNDILTQLLSQNGIEVPSDLVIDELVGAGQTSSPAADLAQPSIATPFQQQDGGGYSHGFLASAAGNLPTPSFGLSPSSGSSPGRSAGLELHVASHSPSSNGGWAASPYASQLLASPRHTNTPLHSTDDSTVGMEFVLILESPCLEHLHGDLSKPEELNCHVFTASAQLLTPNLPPNTPPQCAPGMKDPAAILNRLLALSPDICSDTDVTPIQMWNRIRQQPHSGSLQLQRLRTLAEKLRDAAKCHGFGAVVDAQIFERLLVETVMPRPY